MRDIDHRIGVQLRPRRWHEERTTTTTEDINDSDHFRGARACDFAERAESSGTTDLTVICTAFTERFERYLRDLAAAVIGQLIKCFVGMIRECITHRADRLVVFESDRLAVASICLPVFPGAHQRMLENRQLIGIVADVV